MDSAACAASGANRLSPSPKASADAMATCRSMARSRRFACSDRGALALLLLVLHVALSALLPLVLVADACWLALGCLSAELAPRSGHAAQAFTAPCRTGLVTSKLPEQDLGEQDTRMASTGRALPRL